MSIKQTLSISAPLPNRWGLDLLSWTPRPENSLASASLVTGTMGAYHEAAWLNSHSSTWSLYCPTDSCSPALSCHLPPTYCSWSKSPPAFHVLIIFKLYSSSFSSFDPFFVSSISSLMALCGNCRAWSKDFVVVGSFATLALLFSCNCKTAFSRDIRPCPYPEFSSVKDVFELSAWQLFRQAEGIKI